MRARRELAQHADAPSWRSSSSNSRASARREPVGLRLAEQLAREMRRVPLAQRLRRGARAPRGRRLGARARRGKSPSVVLPLAESTTSGPAGSASRTSAAAWRMHAPSARGGAAELEHADHGQKIPRAPARAPR
jgi:hypothetical protein